jgi:hypothetical protein
MFCIGATDISPPTAWALLLFSQIAERSRGSAPALQTRRERNTGRWIRVSLPPLRMRQNPRAVASSKNVESFRYIKKMASRRTAVFHTKSRYIAELHMEHEQLRYFQAFE